LKACFSDEKKLSWGTDGCASLEEELAEAPASVPAGGSARTPLLPPKHSARPTARACEQCGIRSEAPKYPLEDLFDFSYIKILAAREQFRTTSEGTIEA
jgi:hypothetical protein